MTNKVDWKAECLEAQRRVVGLEMCLESYQKQLRETIEYYGVEKYRDRVTINTLKKEVLNDTPLAIDNDVRTKKEEKRMEELLKELLEEQRKTNELLQVIASNKEQSVSIDIDSIAKQIKKNQRRSNLNRGNVL